MTEYTDFEYSVSPRRRLAVKYHSTYCQAKVHRSPPQKNPLPQRCNNLITVSSRQKHRPSVRFIRLKQSNDDVAVEIARGPNETTVTSNSSEPTIKYSLDCAKIILQILRRFDITK